jgi:RecQ family ATP-dependent DNA helicase
MNGSREPYGPPGYLSSRGAARPGTLITSPGDGAAHANLGPAGAPQGAPGAYAAPGPRYAGPARAAVAPVLRPLPRVLPGPRHELPRTAQRPFVGGAGGANACPAPAYAARPAIAARPAKPRAPAKFNKELCNCYKPSDEFRAAPRGALVDATADPLWWRTNFHWSGRLKKLAHEVLGVATFRLVQLPAINASMAGHDVFCLMPTGGGKSLVFQLLALLPGKGVLVVVSPLKALITDQFARFEALGIRARRLASHDQASPEEQRAELDAVIADARTGELDALFVTAEKIECVEDMRAALEILYREGLLARVAVDEAHCVEEWGHDFRPAYTKLCYFKERFPALPLLALTATATPRDRAAVARELGFDGGLLFAAPGNRPNLEYAVEGKRRSRRLALLQIAEIIAGAPARGDTHARVAAGLDAHGRLASVIVFCSSRFDCEETAAELNAELTLRFGRPGGPGRVAAHYHAEMPDGEREAAQRAWMRREVPIICATIAFGMGIDKPDCPLVIHRSLPRSLSAYAQEAGRGGRDGRPALCMLLYSRGDATKQRQMILESCAKSQAPEEQKRARAAVNLRSLLAMQAYCEEEVRCRRAALLACFGERPAACGAGDAACDACRRRAGRTVSNRFPSPVAAAALAAVRELGGADHLAGSDVAHVTDVLRGSRAAVLERHPAHVSSRAFGALRGDTHWLVGRVLVELVLTGALVENTVRLPQEPGSAYPGRVASWLSAAPREPGARAPVVKLSYVVGWRGRWRAPRGVPPPAPRAAALRAGACAPPPATVAEAMAVQLDAALCALGALAPPLGARGRRAAAAAAAAPAGADVAAAFEAAAAGEGMLLLEARPHAAAVAAAAAQAAAHAARGGAPAAFHLDAPALWRAARAHVAAAWCAPRAAAPSLLALQAPSPPAHAPEAESEAEAEAAPEHDFYDVEVLVEEEEAPPAAALGRAAAFGLANARPREGGAVEGARPAKAPRTAGGAGLGGHPARRA